MDCEKCKAFDTVAKENGFSYGMCEECFKKDKSNMCLVENFFVPTNDFSHRKKRLEILIGSLNNTGVTSENYKDIIYALD